MVGGIISLNTIRITDNTRLTGDSFLGIKAIREEMEGNEYLRSH